MRFRTSHKVVAYLGAGLGIAAIAIGNILHPVLIVLAVLVAIGSWWAEEPLLSKKSYTWAWNIALVLLLLVQIIRIIIGGSLLECGIEFAIALQLSRLWNRKGARDYQQIVVLSLVHLIAASVLDQDASFAIFYAGFVIVLPWAMTLSHLRREIEGNYRRSEPEAQRAHVNRILNSRRIIGSRFLWGTTLLALPIFVMSGVLFLAFPRIGLGFLAGGPRQRISVAGFSDTVQLGDMGIVRNDATVVMRVEIDPMPDRPPSRLNVHWRGAAYDQYNGRQWTRTPRLDKRLPVERIGDRYCITRSCRILGPQTIFRIYLEDLDPPVLLLPQAASVVEMNAQRRGTWFVYRDLFQSKLLEVRRNSEPALVVHYIVEAPLHSDAFFPQAELLTPERDLSPYLQVPDLDPRVAELARRVTVNAQGDPTKSAEAVMNYLRSSYTYSLDLRGTSNDRPLEDFLFRRRSGHCEFFSTAMAVMLRTVGVPTRNVTGFLGGRLNPYGGDGAYYAIAQSDAHSWVEVWIEGRGWVAYDPTPPSTGAIAQSRSMMTIFREIVDATQLAWDKNVIAYDLENQVDFIISSYVRMRRWRTESRREQEAEAQVGGSNPAISFWPIGLLLACVATGFGVRWLIRRRRRGKNFRKKGSRHVIRAESLLYQLDRMLARHGFPRSAWITPKEHAFLLAQKEHPAADIVMEVVLRYNEVRFGEKTFSEGELPGLKAKIRTIGKLSKESERLSSPDEM